MRPQTASRLARLTPVLLAIGLLLGACVTTAAPGWTFEPPPRTASPSASASGSAAPSGSAGPSASASASPGGSASAAPSSSGSAGTTINLSAANIAFDKTQLEAPAGQAFHIAFTNNDSSVQHNVQIKASDGSQVFSGSLITGPASVTYDIGALAAGTYTFSCVVHPAMTGTLIVR